MQRRLPGQDCHRSSPTGGAHENLTIQKRESRRLAGQRLSVVSRGYPEFLVWIECTRTPRAGQGCPFAHQLESAAAPREGIPMPPKRMTFKRLIEIYRRQDPPEPGIKATREEAPKPSWAAEQWSEKLRRYVHSISRPEQGAIRFALFHPQLFELQEQRMMAPDRRLHPLCGHPKAVGMDLPDFMGTVSVADRLDALHALSWIKRRNPATNDWDLVPIPLFGDLLC